MAWGYYKYSQNKIASLTNQNIKLTQELEEKDKYIEKLKIAYDLVQKAKDDVNRSVVASLKEIDSLKNKLNREYRGKTSIEDLAKKKPKMIEKILNNSINETLTCFEKTTDNKECNENS